MTHECRSRTELGTTVRRAQKVKKNRILSALCLRVFPAMLSRGLLGKIRRIPRPSLSNKALSAVGGTYHYDALSVEQKWQKHWAKHESFKATRRPGKVEAFFYVQPCMCVTDVSVILFFRKRNTSSICFPIHRVMGYTSVIR
jgi:hypothetical protein